MYVIGSTSSVVANFGIAFSTLSDLFHEETLRATLAPLLLAAIQPLSICAACLSQYNKG